jgi:curli biogenesis system outer membrane secretion channel CsgG
MRLPRIRGNAVLGALAPFFCILLINLFLSSCATEPLRDDRGKGLAVWDMEDLSPGSSRIDIGELLSARVVETMGNRGNYTVVERTRLVRVLEELRIGSSSLADEETRLRVGKLVGARFMVFGGYQIIGKKMRLDLRLVEVESGKVLKAVQKTTASSDISGWLDAAGKAAAGL